MIGEILNELSTGGIVVVGAFCVIGAIAAMFATVIMMCKFSKYDLWCPRCKAPTTAIRKELKGNQ